MMPMRRSPIEDERVEGMKRGREEDATGSEWEKGRAGVGPVKTQIGVIDT